MGESHTRNTGNNKTCNSLFRTSVLIPNPEVSKLKKKNLKTMTTVQSSK